MFSCKPEFGKNGCADRGAKAGRSGRAEPYYGNPERNLSDLSDLLKECTD